MAPSRVDPNQKQAKSSINQMEGDLFYIDRMARTVSDPSQATAHLANMKPQDLYFECLDEGDPQQLQIKNMVYEIDMQTRHAAARVTVEHYTRPVPIPKKTFSPYGDSDEDSDGPPPSTKKTDATEMKIDESLKIFIEALPHLETLHYRFKFQVLSGNGYCFCALVKCLSPWRKKHHIKNDYSVCAAQLFHGPGLLQNCHDKGDDYHTAAAFYLTKLFKNGTGLTQAVLHHGMNDQSRMTAEGNSGHYFQDIDSQEPNHPYQVNESILDYTGDTAGKGTSMLSGEEIPSQCAKDNDGFNLVDETTDAKSDPSKDSEQTDDVENSTVDEPDGIFDNVEVNTVAEGIDTNDH
jgi:hypothetical protein